MRLIDVIPTAGLLLLVLWIAVLVMRRNAVKSFPAFCIYIFYTVISLSLRLAALENWHLYFKIYWITELGDVSLALATAYQTLFSTFGGLTLLRWCKSIVTLTASFVVAYSIWRAIFRPPVQITRWDSLIFGLEIGFQSLILSMFALFFLAKKFLNSPTRRPWYIALGFGISSFGALCATLVRSIFGNKFPLIGTWGSSVAYFLALVFWIIAFQFTWPEEDIGNNIPIESAAKQLEGYASVLRKER